MEHQIISLFTPTISSRSWAGPDRPKPLCIPRTTPRSSSHCWQKHLRFTRATHSGFSSLSPAPEIMTSLCWRSDSPYAWQQPQPAAITCEVNNCLQWGVGIQAEGLKQPLIIFPFLVHSVSPNGCCANIPFPQHHCRASGFDRITPNGPKRGFFCSKRGSLWLPYYKTLWYEQNVQK